MKRFLYLFASLGIMLGLCFGVAHTAYAVDPLTAACAANPDSPTCKSSTGQVDPVTGEKVNPLIGPNGILNKISLIVATVAGVVAVIIIILSGVRYIMSGGDAQKAASAKSTLIGAVVGLIIIVVAQSIITFVVRKL